MGWGPPLGPWGGWGGKRTATLGPPSQHAHALDLLRTLLASSVAASASVSPSLSRPSQKSGDHRSGRGWPEVALFSLPCAPVTFEDAGLELFPRGELGAARAADIYPCVSP